MAAWPPRAVVVAGRVGPEYAVGAAAGATSSPAIARCDATAPKEVAAAARISALIQSRRWMEVETVIKTTVRTRRRPAATRRDGIVPLQMRGASHPPLMSGG